MRLEMTNQNNSESLFEEQKTNRIDEYGMNHEIDVKAWQGDQCGWGVCIWDLSRIVGARGKLKGSEACGRDLSEDQT